MTQKNFISAFTIILLMSGLSSVSFAQDGQPSPELSNVETVTEDEIIVEGQKFWDNRHDGMKAFFDGDYEMAEIEFEREFKSLRRSESAKENAAFDAENSQLRSQNTAGAISNATSISGGPGGATFSPNSTSAPSNPSTSTTFNNKRKQGTSILMDGKVTYHDFAFTKYMSALSEIKLGKVDEAKKSLQTSLRYNSKNHDALMRLGLIYLEEGDFEQSAKQLTKIDKLRKTCKKTACEDKELIDNSAVTLAQMIMKSARTQ